MLESDGSNDPSLTLWLCWAVGHDVYCRPPTGTMPDDVLGIGVMLLRLMSGVVVSSVTGVGRSQRPTLLAMSRASRRIKNWGVTSAGSVQVKVPSFLMRLAI